MVDAYKLDFDAVINNVFKPEARKEVPAHAQFLIIVDGIDEKNMPAEKQVATLNSLVKTCESRPEIKLVLTSRYFGPIHRKDLSRSLSRVELLPLTPAKMLEFIKRICSNAVISDRIFSDIKHSPLFRDMPRSPIAAILLADLISNNSEDLPSNLPELYSKYLELALGRWDMEKGLQSLKEYETLFSLMMELSQLIMTNELPFLTVTEVKGLFKNYTCRRNVGVSPERVFELMQKRCPIVSVDEAQDRFAFKHRTFAEYMYAQYLIKKRTFKIDCRAFNPYWDNTFYFAIGTLRDCPDELKQLDELTPNTDIERFLKIVNMSNYLMAAFQTPYDVISIAIKNVTLEAARFYKDILTKSIVTDLENFAEMQLLCLFQHIMRNGYAYSFFEKAIDSAAIEIANMPMADDLKAYALFFLNVTRIELGKETSFDWLLKDYAKILPLSVQLGISHEGGNLPARSALMRRHDRALRHAIRMNKALGVTLEKMYGHPIHSLRAVRRREFGKLKRSR